MKNSKYPKKGVHTIILKKRKQLGFYLFMSAYRLIILNNLYLLMFSSVFYLKLKFLANLALKVLIKIFYTDRYLLPIKKRLFL